MAPPLGGHDVAAVPTAGRGLALDPVGKIASGLLRQEGWPYAPGSFTVRTGNYWLMAGFLQLTAGDRATLEGTARLRIT